MTARVSLNGGDHRRPYVCRRLFADEIGPQQEGLSDNANNEIIERLRQETVEASRKWNFDFINERPLEGNWVWERVAPPVVERQTTADVVVPVQRSVDDDSRGERLEVSEDASKSICNAHVNNIVAEQFKTP